MCVTCATVLKGLSFSGQFCARKLISYRLDFPRRAPGVAFIEELIEIVEILLDHILLTIPFFSVCILAGGEILGIYYASITRYYCY